MTALKLQPNDTSLLWDRYRHNVSRHLLAVAGHLQSSMMKSLQDRHGHKDLRLGFAPYITLIGEGDKRLTDLAQILGISRQACNQAVKQVEAAGYLARTADPVDGRAKQLTLSRAGVKLRRDGLHLVTELDQQFADIVGEEAMQHVSRSLSKIYNRLELGLRNTRGEDYPNTVMGGLLPRLGDYTLARLMELTRAKGHPGLKLSYAQVLTQIGPAGGRIQQMAATADISKQAISAIASELETLQYVRREIDPLDARQIVLHFTARGEALIADSVASVEQMEAEFGAIIGKPALKQMKATLYQLYRGLQLEQEVFENERPTDIKQLAQQLQQQLGTQASKALARLLLNQTQNTR